MSKSNVIAKDTFKVGSARTTCFVTQESGKSGTYNKVSYLTSVSYYDKDKSEWVEKKWESDSDAACSIASKQVAMIWGAQQLAQLKEKKTFKKEAKVASNESKAQAMSFDDDDIPF